METLASAFSGPFSVSAESNGSWHKRVVDMSPISGQKEIQKPLFDAFWASMCSMFYLLPGLPLPSQIPQLEGKAVRDKVYIPTLDPTNTKYSDL